jgi:hypothetical protein
LAADGGVIEATILRLWVMSSISMAFCGRLWGLGEKPAQKRSGAWRSAADRSYRAKPEAVGGSVAGIEARPSSPGAGSSFRQRRKKATSQNAQRTATNHAQQFHRFEKRYAFHKKRSCNSF